MDKERVLEVLKKYHFWVLLGVVIAATLGVGMLAMSQTGAKTEQRRRVIKGRFDGVSDIARRPDAPNEALITNTQEETQRQTKIAYEAWSGLYRRMKQSNQLPETLTQGFKDAFEIADLAFHSPPQLVEKFDGRTPTEEEFEEFAAYHGLPQEKLPVIREVLQNRGELSQSHRIEYQTFIRYHFPKLFNERVKVLRKVQEEDAAGNTGNGGTQPAPGPMPGAFSPGGPEKKREEKWEGLIRWEGRDEIEKRFTWEDRPSTTEVLLAQEDLWVYEALLNIIINTNKIETGEVDENGEKIVRDPVSREECAVKTIETLQIGRKVARTIAQTGPSVFATVGAEGEEEEEEEEGTRPVAAATTGPGESEETAEELADVELLANRYVDEKGQPLGAGAKNPFPQFNVMPIRMKLVIDQTKIPKILAECANSSMPVDVRRFRIRPGKRQELGLGAKAVRPGGAHAGMPRIGRPPVAQPVGAGKRGGAEDDVSASDVPIEIEGVIYIYKPPTLKELETEESSEEPDETTPATEPTTPPATEPTTPPATGPTTPPATEPTTPPATEPTTPPESEPTTTPATEPTTPPAPGPATTPPAAVGSTARIGAGICGARFHRAGHVGNVPHNQYATLNDSLIRRS